MLIVEAEKRSGTSITARYAEEQGKDVFCIPSAIENKKGIGTNALIRKGAKLVQTPEEILREYINTKRMVQISIDDLEKKSQKIDIQNIKEEYREIYKILEEPLSANEISEKTGIDVTEVYSKLFLMEVEELIKPQGNKYIIA